MKYVNRDMKQFKDYSIFCYTYETQYNWGHVVEIAPTDNVSNTLASAKITYYNRTWECYRYQSCILSAIDNLIENRKSELIEAWKLANGKSRTTKEQKEIAVAGDKLLAEYREMYNYFRDEYRSFV